MIRLVKAAIHVADRRRAFLSKLLNIRSQHWTHSLAQHRVLYWFLSLEPYWWDKHTHLMPVLFIDIDIGGCRAKADELLASVPVGARWTRELLYLQWYFQAHLRIEFDGRAQASTGTWLLAGLLYDGPWLSKHYRECAKRYQKQGIQITMRRVAHARNVHCRMHRLIMSRKLNVLLRETIYTEQLWP